jgi:hypothetical protein
MLARRLGGGHTSFTRVQAKRRLQLQSSEISESLHDVKAACVIEADALIVSSLHQCSGVRSERRRIY